MRKHVKLTIVCFLLVLSVLHFTRCTYGLINAFLKNNPYNQSAGDFIIGIYMAEYYTDLVNCEDAIGIIIVLISALLLVSLILQRKHILCGAAVELAMWIALPISFGLYCAALVRFYVSELYYSSELYQFEMKQIITIIFLIALALSVILTFNAIRVTSKYCEMKEI